jgi:hypothetical protein
LGFFENKETAKIRVFVFESFDVLILYFELIGLIGKALVEILGLGPMVKI